MDLHITYARYQDLPKDTLRHLLLTPWNYLVRYAILGVFGSVREDGNGAERRAKLLQHLFILVRTLCGNNEEKKGKGIDGVAYNGLDENRAAYRQGFIYNALGIHKALGRRKEVMDDLVIINLLLLNAHTPISDDDPLIVKVRAYIHLYFKQDVFLVNEPSPNVLDELDRMETSTKIANTTEIIALGTTLIEKTYEALAELEDSHSPTLFSPSATQDRLTRLRFALQDFESYHHYRMEKHEEILFCIQQNAAYLYKLINNDGGDNERDDNSGEDALYNFLVEKGVIKALDEVNRLPIVAYSNPNEEQIELIRVASPRGNKTN